LNPEQIQLVIKQKLEGPDKVGFHPETGEPIYLLTGRYGPYIQLGEKTEENKKPKQASLPKGVTPEQVTLAMAVGLLSLPRLLGVHPETGDKIKAGLGRFGPYVVLDRGKDGQDYRSLKAEDDVITVSLERALELLAQPKRSRGARSSSKQALRELGNHPQDNQPVNIYEGPYGKYIKHNKTNVGIPEGETVESMTLEKALQLLNAKAGTKKSTGKSTTKSKTKSTAKSTTSKSTKTKTATKTSAKAKKDN
jgi:DNA topoisomerase-1